MGRKDVLAAWPMFGSSGADMSGSRTSNITTVQYMDNVGIVVNWTGTSPVGTFTVEVSNDNFLTSSTLDFGSTITISGNSGSHLIDINQLPYGYIRAKYNFTSGTGTLTAVLSSKQLGG